MNASRRTACCFPSRVDKLTLFNPTRLRKLSFPGCLFVVTPLPHRTSLWWGFWISTIFCSSTSSSWFSGALRGSPFDCPIEAGASSWEGWKTEESIFFWKVEFEICDCSTSLYWIDIALLIVRGQQVAEVASVTDCVTDELNRLGNSSCSPPLILLNIPFAWTENCS